MRLLSWLTAAVVGWVERVARMSESDMRDYGAQKIPGIAALARATRLRRSEFGTRMVKPRESGVCSALRPFDLISTLWNTGFPAFAGNDSEYASAVCARPRPPSARRPMTPWRAARCAWRIRWLSRWRRCRRGCGRRYLA